MSHRDGGFATVKSNGITLRVWRVLANVITRVELVGPKGDVRILRFETSDAGVAGVRVTRRTFIPLAEILTLTLAQHPDLAGS